MPADELMEKSVTVFAREGGVKDGRPHLWDYQIRGFFKEVIGALVEFNPMEIKVKGKKYKLSKWTYKRIVDNFIFVTPREIPLILPEGVDIGEKVVLGTGECTRPLRADTQRGPRVALATSETVPVGTTFECEIHSIVEELMPLVVECLNYGVHKGMGQWRNSGKGRFTWEEVA